MAQYGWVIAVVVVMGLVQFAVYYYLRTRTDASRLPARESTPPAMSPDRAPEPRVRDEDEPTTGLYCPTCGTVNEPGFTFCRRCVGRIGA